VDARSEAPTEIFLQSVGLEGSWEDCGNVSTGGLHNEAKRVNAMPKRDATCHSSREGQTRTTTTARRR
jgi:hypothetical protein